MRLIDADEYFEILRDDLEMPGVYFRRAIDHLNNMKNTDAVEVVHGKWILREDGYHCSNCDIRAIYTGSELKYCPNCGAKMDGGN